tara:strand:+ start:2127 stop:2453 length:327 start_codon:yes stop_codon:yes gene_type:complete
VKSPCSKQCYDEETDKFLEVPAMYKKLSTTIGLVLLFAGPTGADESKDTEAEASKLEIALAKYDRTGEMKTCINPRRIRDMKIVDDNHILFRVSGKKSYLNTLLSVVE